MRQDDRRPGAGGYNQGRPPGPNYAAMTEYYDGDGRLKREVFIEWPKQIAENIRISRTNMRRAYDFVAAMRFQILMDKEKKPLDVLRPGMGQLHRFVQYQAGRDRMWEDAKPFFQTHIKAVGDDPQKFEGFYQLFQSVMAYLRR